MDRSDQVGVNDEEIEIPEDCTDAEKIFYWWLMNHDKEF